MSGELEAVLKAQALAQGLPADKLARRVLEHVLTPGAEGGDRGAFSVAAGTSGQENAVAFVQWAESFPDTPPLSDEAVSRTAMYPDRW